MGCGACYKQHGKAFEVDTTMEAPANSEARREFRKLEDELVWLRKVFEKEKAEKKWIMERYERVESDLIARNEEATQLRAQVETLRENGGLLTVMAGPPTYCSAPLLKASTIAPSANVPTSEVPAVARPLSRDSRDSAPLSPGAMSLKERRGRLSLTVVTNSAVTAKPADDVQVSVQQAPALQPVPQRPAPALLQTQTQETTAESVSAKPELRAASPPASSPSPAELVNNSKKEEFLASLANPREEGEMMVEPMTAKASVGRNRGWNCDDVGEAPMSPLLRRRRDNDHGRVRNKKNSGRFVTSPGNLLSPTTGLSLKTVKIDKLDLVPPSPKRIPPTPGKRKAAQDAQWATPIVEEVTPRDDEEDNPMIATASCRW